MYCGNSERAWINNRHLFDTSVYMIPCGVS